MLVSNRKALAEKPNLNVAVILTVLALLVLSRGLGVGNTYADTSSASPNTTHCESAVAQAYNSIDQSTAIDNSLASSAYSQGAAGYSNPTFNSIFQIADVTTGYPACTITVHTYNVVFTLHSSTGSIAGNLVVSESPQDLSVIGYNLQTQVASGTTNSMIWAGQQVSANSGATANVTSIDSTWYQPSITPESGSGESGCGSPNVCTISDWVGLANTLFSGQGNLNAELNQDGTTAYCHTSSSSSTSCDGSGGATASAWYQSVLNNANEVQCNSTGYDVQVRPGNEIYASVSTSEANYYDFFVENESKSPHQTCYAAIDDTYMIAPNYAEAIVENTEASSGSGYYPLGTFSITEFYGTYLGTDSTDGYINDFTTYTTDMYNQAGTWPSCTGSGATDATSGSLDSSGDFTVTYDTSQYTPAYTNGC